MTNQYNSQINFTAKLSPEIEKRLIRQTKLCDTKARLTKALSNKLQDISHWGPENSEIVYCKNIEGKQRLGLKIKTESGFFLSWAFENINGRNILSQFLNLRESHFTSTEQTINYLFKKYGLEIFKKYRYIENEFLRKNV